MEVVYNVKSNYKKGTSNNSNEIKDIINKKLLNIIITLENKDLVLKSQ